MQQKSLPVLTGDSERISDLLNSSASSYIYSGDNFPPYWSKSRDKYLRRIVVSNDYLSAVLYSAIVKLASIPFRIIPRNAAVAYHVEMAETYDTIFQYAWRQVRDNFIMDIIGQDNGGFLEILDSPTDSNTPPDRPRTTFGGFRYLDSARCRRTSNPDYPVVIEHTDGRLYKLHNTRVVAISQMQSGDIRMNGVGLCAVSRALYNIQFLTDILVLYQEYMGSRPQSQAVIANGLTAEQIKDVFEEASRRDDAEGLHWYSKMVFIGFDTAAGMQGDIKLLALKGLPDGFDKKTELLDAMHLMALAFGFDIREFWTSSQIGATKADALIQHMKARSKTVAWFIENISGFLLDKVLPSALDVQSSGTDDDELDRQKADIQNTQAQTDRIEIETGVMDTRGIRLRLVNNGRLSQSEFERLELKDGRLPDGRQLLSLFYNADDEVYGQYLAIGYDPLRIDPEDYDDADMSVDAKLRESMTDLNLATRPKVIHKLTQSIAALNFLKSRIADARNQLREVDLQDRRLSLAEERIIGRQDDLPRDVSEAEQLVDDDNPETPNPLQAKKALIYSDGTVEITDGDVTRTINRIAAWSKDLSEVLQADVVDE